MFLFCFFGEGLNDDYFSGVTGLDLNQSETLLLLQEAPEALMGSAPETRYIRGNSRQVEAFEAAGAGTAD